MRILVLVTDAFGGYGGIALYNRDVLKALCSLPDCKEVVAIPRLMPNAPESMPGKLQYVTEGLGGKFSFIRTVLSIIWRSKQFDLILCGHINLLPLSYLAGLITRAPLLLQIYGIDAWEPSKSALVNKLLKNIDAFISISDLTRQRFLSWAGIDSQKGSLLPNAIDASRYAPGPVNAQLQNRFGLKGKTVLLTLGRLVSHDRHKGFDEVLELLPELRVDMPEIVYLVAGKGDDRKRLEEKARNLGVADIVVFTGFIAEEEKPDLYRLADVYVMPSRGEGFGFVFLEALACGVPCIGSKIDGSREALRDGKLGRLVDPDDPRELKQAIIDSLAEPQRKVPEGLQYFSFENFSDRLDKIITQVVPETTL